MAKVLEIVRDAEMSIRTVTMMGWAFTSSILLIVAAYGFAILKIAGF